MPETNKTKLVAANTTNSLRCTIPAHIVKMLELSIGDHLEWHVRAVKSKFVIEVVPIRDKSQ